VFRTPNVAPILEPQHHVADLEPKLEFRRTSKAVNDFLNRSTTSLMWSRNFSVGGPAKP
jgi:hypothetical protein